MLKGSILYLFILLSTSPQMPLQERLVELWNVGQTKSHGHLLLRPQFLPAGTLRCHVMDAKGLPLASDQRQDP
jgi:hypothetical protein